LREKVKPPALGKGEDIDTLEALLLTECRIMYTNVEICTWIEEEYKLFFVETHNKLKETQNEKIN
jgi:hypothetical protein